MNEDAQLARVRNVGMDVMATTHMIDAKKKNIPWNCICDCCEYVRKEPRLVAAIQKALDK